MPFKAVNVNNIDRNNHFYYFIKFVMLQQKNDKDHINVCFIPLKEIAKQLVSNF